MKKKRKEIKDMSTSELKQHYLRIKKENESKRAHREGATWDVEGDIAL